jgi:L-ascorbate metabolism protein UlaG (beta-lactamase superfamily)
VRVPHFLLVALLLLVPSAASAQDTKKAELLWLGQSCWKITTPGGKVIVVDPWLIRNPRTPQEYKKLEALGKVDLILVTHAHADHFADAPELSRMNNAPMYGPAGLNQSLLTLGVLDAKLVPRFNKGGTIAPFGPDGPKITAVHAEHSSELVWKNAEGKDQTYVGGEPMGFIIQLENGLKIYHMGDTGLFGDMKLIGEYYKPDVVLIPIGGHFVMDPKDAAYATREFLKPRHAVPMHYGTNIFLKGTPEEYIEALGKTTVKVHPIAPGEKLTF